MTAHCYYFFGARGAAKLAAFAGICVELQMKFPCHFETFFLFI